MFVLQAFCIYTYANVCTYIWNIVIKDLSIIKNNNKTSFKLIIHTHNVQREIYEKSTKLKTSSKKLLKNYLKLCSKTTQK